jgi:hypothetical protein
MLSFSLPAKEGRGQSIPTLTVSSDATTAGWTYDNGTRTLTVTSSSKANVSDILGYLNSGSLTIVGAPSAFDGSTNVSVTFNASINSSVSGSGLIIGDISNIGDIAFLSDISVAGPISVLGSNTVQVNSNITSTIAGDINLNCNTAFSSQDVKRNAIVTAGGAITINADRDANGSGILILSNLTLNPGVGSIIIRGETFNWLATDPLPNINTNGESIQYRKQVFHQGTFPVGHPRRTCHCNFQVRRPAA